MDWRMKMGGGGATPTMVVLVAARLSWRGPSRLGGRLQLLHQGGAGGVELPHRGGPRQVLDHVNLNCKCRPESPEETTTQKGSEER